jgi:Amt family ammonium transporter
MLFDWRTKGKPSAVGIAVGAVCGLVAITPAAGYVATLPAILIGLVVGVLSNLVMGWRARTRLDDSLDVFAAHGAGSIWGVLATGIFASTTINAAGPDGAIYGNFHQLGVEALGILVVFVYGFVGSFVLLKVINVFTPVRVSPAEEETGLDMTQHGEEAYA